MRSQHAERGDVSTNVIRGVFVQFREHVPDDGAVDVGDLEQRRPREGVEAKYYADGEDAYNMRMTFREGPRADADVGALEEETATKLRVGAGARKKRVLTGKNRR